LNQNLFQNNFFNAAIKATTDALQEEGYECAAYVVDISDKDKVYEAAKKVKEEIGKVDVLINNAGIVTCRTFLELPDKAIEATYGVNILSHYWVNLLLVIILCATLTYLSNS
jgi:all-trans-retinol dehydrogenase (NAD+)